MKNMVYLVWYMPATEPGEIDGKWFLWCVCGTEGKAEETVKMILRDGYGVDAHWTDEPVE